MGKINKAYPNLLGGVSQQVPEQRRPGQHWAQTNMVADPVLGLVRRPGSLYLGQVAATLDADDAPNYRAVDFRVGSKDYSLFLPFAAQTSGTAQNAYCVNKTDNVVVPVAAPNGTVQAMLNAGLSAATAVGRFILMAGPGLDTTYTTVEQWDNESNQSRHIVWIRGGGYSRKFRFAIIRGNQKFWTEYTTLEASYPYSLDTTDLVTTDPDYVKKLNDRTNDFNTKVTQWIGLALEDALPTNIAAKLAAELQVSGFLGTGATVEVKGSTICITDTTIEEIEVDDGGDNTLIRGVGNAVGAPELLSTNGYPGKVVQVRPNANTEGDVFYLRARAKDGSTGAFTAVTWEETAGTLYTPTQALAFATVEGGICYIGNTPANIASLSGVAFQDYIPSEAGDSTSSAPPAFLDNGITALGLFQDRLIVGSGATFFASRPGDYLNWFRASILSVQASDPVSFVAIGGEDDTLRHTVIYDRNLVLFGDKQQYLIDGRKALEPRTASATVMAAYPNAAVAEPIIVGNFLFYGKSSDDIATVHQLRPGAIAESPENYELSIPLEDYLPGVPWELQAGTSPSAIYIRTTGDSNSVYIYGYLDSQGNERQFEAWYKWEFDAALGNIAGISLGDGYVYVGFFRGATFTVDRVPLNVKTDMPYLDSMLTYVGPSRGAGYVRANGRAGNYDGGTTGTYEGYPMSGHVTLSSPYMVDRQDNVVSTGRLTVNTVTVQMKDVGGVSFKVESSSTPCWGAALHGQLSTPAAEDDLDLTLVGPDCPVTPDFEGVVLDTFSTDGTLATRDGEVGADWTGSYSNWSNSKALADVVVDNGRAYIPASGSSNSATFFASGIADYTQDTYIELEMVVPAGYSGRPQAEICLTSDPTLANPTAELTVYAQANTGGTAFWGVGGSATRPVFNGFAFDDSTPFAVDTPVILRLELTNSGTTLTAFMNDVQVWTETLAGFDSYWTGFAYYNSQSLNARTLDVLRIETGYLGAAPAACDPPVEGPTLPVTGGCGSIPGGGSFSYGTMSLADQADLSAATVVNAKPYEDSKLVIPIGRESRDYRLTLGTYRWAPLTIATVEWVGQYFNNTRRI